METPVLCWCCTINPSISDEEYMACYNAVLEAWPNTPFAEKLKDMPRNYDTLREILTYLMPLLMMRQQRIPRNQWILHQNERGKKWIERLPRDPSQVQRFAGLMTGYTTAFDFNMVVLAACQGKKSHVTNIGLSVKRISADGAPVHQWAQSQQHKLTPDEVRMLAPLHNDDVLLSRLMIILAIKESLMNGLGQPIGFDLSRISVDPSNDTLLVDGRPFMGWEFRLFRSQAEATVGPAHYVDQYQMCAAYFRGGEATKFIFIDKPDTIEKFTQYFPFDRLVDVIPRLLQDLNLNP